MSDHSAVMWIFILVIVIILFYCIYKQNVEIEGMSILDTRSQHTGRKHGGGQRHRRGGKWQGGGRYNWPYYGYEYPYNYWYYSYPYYGGWYPYDYVSVNTDVTQAKVCGQYGNIKYVCNDPNTPCCDNTTLTCKPNCASPNCLPDYSSCTTQ